MATELISGLEDIVSVLKKTLINIKKCPKVRLTQGYIEKRIENVEIYWQSYHQVYSELVKTVPRDKRTEYPYFVSDSFMEHEELYVSLVADLKDLIISETSKQSVSTPMLNKPENQGTSTLARLPKIQLPTFSGRYEEWPAYQDMYVSLVHSNLAISNVQKLHYLKSSTSGEAEALLRHIQITNENYNQAWEILKSRYGNKRLIVFSTLKRLFNQKKMHCSSASQIKLLMDTTTECLFSLENQTINISDWDPIIIYIVVQRLDTDLHKDWEMYSYSQNSEELPKWSDMKQFLETKYRTFEMITPSTSSPHNTQAKERPHQVHHVAAAENENIKCPFCNEGHKLCHCKQFCQMNPEERSEFVRSKFLCFNCLTFGHSIKHCRRPSSCKICHKRHHSLLHQKGLYNNSGTSCHKSQPELSSHAHVEEEEESEEVNVNTVTMPINASSAKKKIALLATALVIVRHEGHTSVLRALIDPGAQGCFITERAAQLLKAKRYPVKGRIVGVGSTTTNIKQVVQVEVISRHEIFSLNVRAYVLKGQLTTLIPSKSIEAPNWNHIEGLTLADAEFHKPGHIDMLLGVDEYAQIIKDNVIKGPPGAPCAQSTSLGWILFGEVQDVQKEDQPQLVLHQTVDIEEPLKPSWEVKTDAITNFDER